MNLLDLLTGEDPGPGVREVLERAIEQTEGRLAVLRDTLAVLDGEAEAVAEDQERPPVSEVLDAEHDNLRDALVSIQAAEGADVPPRVAMCRNGCTTWNEGERNSCPVCHSGGPIFPSHLQPVPEDKPGELAPVLPHVQAVTLESVRDYVTKVHKGGAKFSTGTAAQFFRCSQDTVRPFLDDLASLGTLKRELGFGSRGRWWSVQPLPDDAPKERPRHLDAVGTGAAAPPVAFTGRPMGGTGKPGLDKKLAQKRKVVRK